MTALKKVKSRTQRVQILPLHRVAFWQSEPRRFKPLEIVNLSVTGIGFLRSGLPAWPQAGSTVKGELDIDGKRFPMSIELKSIGNSIVGGSIKNPPSDYPISMIQYFDKELTAQSMKRVRSQSLRNDPEGIPHLYISDEHCELYFVTQGDQLIRFHIAFFGNVLAGKLKEKLQYGTIRDESFYFESDPLEIPRSDLSAWINWKESLPDSITSMAIRLVGNIPALDAQHREALLANLNK